MQPAKSTNITTSGGALNPKLPPIPATPLRTGGDSGNLQATNYGHSAGNENATRPGGKLDAFTAARDGKVEEGDDTFCLTGLNHNSAGVSYILKGGTKQVGMATVDSLNDTHCHANNRT